MRAYSDIAEQVRRDILRGKLRPAQQLAPERQLCQQYGASRITIRHALRILAEEGLVDRRHGSGTYVRSKPERRVPLMIDYTASMRQHVPTLRRRLLSKSWDVASAEEAAELQVQPGSRVLRIQRLDESEDASLAWDCGCIPEPFAADLRDTELQRVDFLEAWARRENLRIDACKQVIDAIAAAPRCAAMLGLTKNAPVLCSTETYLLTDGRPCGLFISYYNPRQIRITSRLRLSHPRRREEEP